MSDSTAPETTRRNVRAGDRVQWHVAGTWDKERRDWQWRHGAVLSIFRHHPGEGLAAMVQPDDDEYDVALHLGSLQRESAGNT